jgi:hypothetical protein
MNGPRRRPFILNVAGVDFVCSFNTFLGFAQSEGREGNRRENVDTTAGDPTMRNISLSLWFRWAYGVRAAMKEFHAKAPRRKAERAFSEN